MADTTLSETEHLSRAEAAYAAGRADEALEHYDTLAATQSHAHEGHYGAGLVLLHQRRFAEAIDRLTKAAKAGGRADNAWFYIGRAEEQRGNPGAAQSAYRKALRANRDHVAAARALESVEAQRRMRRHIGWRAPLPLRVLIFVVAFGIVGFVLLQMAGITGFDAFGLATPSVEPSDRVVTPIRTDGN